MDKGTNYRRCLEQLIHEIKSHPALEVKEAYLGAGLNQEMIRRFTERKGVTLSPALDCFFQSINGGVIQWRLKTSHADLKPRPRAFDYPDGVWGMVDLTTLQELLEEPDVNFADSVWTSAMDDTNRKELHYFRPLDNNSPEAMTGLLLKRRRLTKRVYFLKQEAEALFSTHAGIEKYIRAMRQARGFVWWQKVFAMRPTALADSPMFHYISQLFPEESFSEFRK
jgi:hypothetical protein